MEKQLVGSFIPTEHWPNKGSDDQVGFDSFYDTLMKWACTQDKLGYEEFAAADIQREAREKEMEEVQKKRDAAALEAMKNVQAKDGKTAEVAK